MWICRIYSPGTGRMSVTMTRTDRVTVFTLTSDPQSCCPPLCQILKALEDRPLEDVAQFCYSPVCCPVSRPLKKVQRTSQSVLGVLHIMIGLLNVGLGVILMTSGPGSRWTMDVTKYPIWLAVLFIVFGIVCILSEKYPSPCLVSFSVILNLVGVAFAITAIVLYSINIGNIYVWWRMCDDDYDDYYGYRRHVTTPSPSHEKQILQEKCLEGRELALMLLRSINAVLIVLSVLELCVTISSAVLGIKALRSSQKEPNKSAEDPETYKPLLEGVTTQPAA